MKEEIRYELADINLDDEKHKFIYSQIIVATLLFTLAAPHLKNKGDDAVEEEIKKLTASFLSAMHTSGFELVKREQSVPAVFREGTV